jgi:hypothetical protein
VFISEERWDKDRMSRPANIREPERKERTLSTGTVGVAGETVLISELISGLTPIFPPVFTPVLTSVFTAWIVEAGRERIASDNSCAFATPLWVKSDSAAVMTAAAAGRIIFFKESPRERHTHTTCTYIYGVCAHVYGVD